MYLLIISHQCSQMRTFLTSHADDPLSSIDTIQAHSEGVAELLSNIDSSKAYGPDNLPARFLKEVSSEIASALTLIFH